MQPDPTTATMLILALTFSVDLIVIGVGGLAGWWH